MGEAVESQKLRSWIVPAQLGAFRDYSGLVDFSLEHFGITGGFRIFLEAGQKRSSLYNWQAGENPTLSWALL